jgi:type III pantothenate kinase
VILCVDIGNTAIKMARVSAGRVAGVVAVPSGAPAGEISRALARCAGHAGRATAAAISSVRPAATGPVVRAIRRELGLEPLVVTVGARLPIVVATRAPGRVGIDRICAACGATRGRSRHAIVVDAGSAITVDLVLDRRFLGGVILPGPQMMLSALHAFTAQLPELSMAGVAAGRIDDTRSAMGWGALLGASGGIRGAVEMLEARSGRRPRRWLTGGHAARLRPRLPGSWSCAPHLTLLGLAAIAELNPV